MKKLRKTFDRSWRRNLPIKLVCYKIDSKGKGWVVTEQAIHAFRNVAER